jgi:MFS-type transporter involved in bile tolerance (Atg22 family)
LRAASLGISEAQIPLVYATLNVATVVLGFPSGMLADKIGKIPVLFLSYVAFLFTCVTGIVLVGNSLYAYLIAFLFGTYLGISDTIQRAVIPEFTRNELKGTAYAFYYLLIGAGSFVANSAFGFLWSSMSSSMAFQYSILTSIAGAAALILFSSVWRK